jgi:hypothetical protein
MDIHIHNITKINIIKKREFINCKDVNNHCSMSIIITSTDINNNELTNEITLFGQNRESFNILDKTKWTVYENE